MTTIDLTDEQVAEELAAARRGRGWSGRDIEPPSVEAARALARHGYNWRALAAGVSGGAPRTWTGHEGVLLRPKVCTLDGIDVDGHEGSEFSPDACIHCGFDFADLD